MPWLVGDRSEARILPVESDGLALSLLLEAGAAYAGYLLSGFAQGDEVPRFRPERIPLAMRAGWHAVAPAARTDDPALARHLGPFLAPTAARPHLGAPLGFALFSVEWLRSALGAQAAERRPEIEWAARLTSMLGKTCPVFCDPVLELDLTGRTAAEGQACLYRARPAWRGALAYFQESR
jgi:hypothetical protein